MDILIYWYIDTSKMLVFHYKYVYFWHPDNKNIDLSLVFYVFCAFRDGVWDSWLGLAGLPGRAGRAGPSESIRGAKNIEKPCKNGPGLSGTLCFPCTFWTPWTPNTHCWPGNASGASNHTLRNLHLYLFSPPGPHRDKLCLGYFNMLILRCIHWYIDISMYWYSIVVIVYWN